MTTVSMFEAKTNLSKYVAAVNSGQEPFIVIVRNSKPVAKIIPYENNLGTRLGVAKGQIPELASLEDFNSIDVEQDFVAEGTLI